jgi:hypothetical protein
VTGPSALLDAALGYGARRRPIFPVGVDKRPLTPHGFKDATTDQAQIRAWWDKWPTAGIATPTGPDWFVLDADDPAALEALEAEHGPLPPTIEVVTPRPGRHLYLRGTVTNGRGALPDGIDVRGRGGYVLLPPSPHKNGVYEWREAPDEVEMSAAPPWLLELLSAGQNGSAPAVEGDIPAHQRNATLASMGGTMRRRGFSGNGIAAALLVENRERCKPPLSESEVRKIARSVARYKPADDAVGSLDDLTGLLGLADVGKRIDAVRVYGRGSNAIAHIHLDDGERIVLDPLGRFATLAKLTAELALQAGASPVLKAPDVVRALVLFHKLADHYENVEVEDRAWELGAEYLRSAAIGDVAMDDQASRWQAFAALAASRRTDVVLADTATGIRYVRTGWFEGYVRGQTGVSAGRGEPGDVLARVDEARLRGDDQGDRAQARPNVALEVLLRAKGLGKMRSARYPVPAGVPFRARAHARTYVVGGYLRVPLD